MRSALVLQWRGVATCSVIFNLDIINLPKLRAKPRPGRTSALRPWHLSPSLAFSDATTACRSHEHAKLWRYLY